MKIVKMNFIKNNETIKQIGYGAMVLEGYYEKSNDKQAVYTLVHAIKISKKEAFIASKFGIF